eukprot:9799528-Ditylum_brightwellii.AAC.2
MFATADTLPPHWNGLVQTCTNCFYIVEYDNKGNPLLLLSSFSEWNFPTGVSVVPPSSSSPPSDSRENLNDLDTSVPEGAEGADTPLPEGDLPMTLPEGASSCASKGADSASEGASPSPSSSLYWQFAGNKRY